MNDPRRRLLGSLALLPIVAAGCATIAPPDDPNRPWRVAAAVRTAFRWEPMRAAAMRPNELAETVLSAFRRSVEALGRASG